MQVRVLKIKPRPYPAGLYFFLPLKCHNGSEIRTSKNHVLAPTSFSIPVMKLTNSLRPSGYSLITQFSGVVSSA